MISADDDARLAFQLEAGPQAGQTPIPEAGIVRLIAAPHAAARKEGSLFVTAGARGLCPRGIAISLDNP